MKRLRLAMALLTAVLVFAAPRFAAADDSSALPTAPEPSGDSASGFAITLAGGWAGNVAPIAAPHWSHGAMLSVQGLGHYGPLEAGGSAEVGLAGVALFASDCAARAGVNALAGAGSSLGSVRGDGVRADLLMELGVHDYAFVGACGFDNSGISGTVPHVGVRVDLSLLAPPRPETHARGLGQVWLFARKDLTSQVVSYEYNGFLDDSGKPSHAQAQMGGGFEIGLAIGAGFDLH